MFQQVTPEQFVFVLIACLIFFVAPEVTALVFLSIAQKWPSHITYIAAFIGLAMSAGRWYLTIRFLGTYIRTKFSDTLEQLSEATQTIQEKLAKYDELMQKFEELIELKENL